MPTGKAIDLTRWIFVGKVMFLFFNMLSMLVITFLPRSKRLFFFSVLIWGSLWKKITDCTLYLPSIKHQKLKAETHTLKLLITLCGTELEN